MRRKPGKHRGDVSLYQQLTLFYFSTCIRSLQRATSFPWSSNPTQSRWEHEQIKNINLLGSSMPSFFFTIPTQKDFVVIILLVGYHEKDACSYKNGCSRKKPCWSYSGNSPICFENRSASLISSSLSPFQGCFLPWSGFLASWKKVDDAPTGQVCRMLSKVVEKKHFTGGQ